MEIIVVYWVDACFRPGAVENLSNCAIVPKQTVGYMVPTDDAAHISVAHEYRPDDKQYCDITTIPMGCVTKIEHTNEQKSY